MNIIVIKVGSAVLTQNNKLAQDRLKNLVELIVKLKDQYHIILVSSGAVAAGYTLLKLDKNIISNKQALASIGQPLLLDSYRKEFNNYNIICSQVLLEASLFNDNKRLSHTKDTITTLLQNNVVPIINENDVTAIDELVFGDNDQLSAHIAYHFDASLLVILTDIDGYYDDNPTINKDAKIIKEVNYISEEELNAEHSAHTEFATGGIVTKLKAANFLMKNSRKMFLSSGFDLSYVSSYLLKNKYIKGTIFKEKDE